MISKTFHIVGICGIGMSAIAQILKSFGHQVQGSDICKENLLQLLAVQNLGVFEYKKARDFPARDGNTRSIFLFLLYLSSKSFN